MKFKYLVIVTSLIGVSLLYVVSSLSQPTVISLSLVPINEGKQVRVTGVVTMYQTTTYGSQLITIRDANDSNPSTIILYIEGEIIVEYGDLVEATGTVQQYNDAWEITISNPRFVIVRQHWQNCSFPVWQLAKNPARYVDTNVNVTGIIGVLTNTGFSLHDADGTYVVFVSCPHATESSFLQGDLATIRARFLYNQETLCYFLQVTDPAQDIVVQEEGSHA